MVCHRVLCHTDLLRRDDRLAGPGRMAYHRVLSQGLGAQRREKSSRLPLGRLQQLTEATSKSKLNRALDNLCDSRQQLRTCRHRHFPTRRCVFMRLAFIEESTSSLTRKPGICKQFHCWHIRAACAPSDLANFQLALRCVAARECSYRYARTCTCAGVHTRYIYYYRRARGPAAGSHHAEPC
jgi:hypothetical protein